MKRSVRLLIALAFLPLLAACKEKVPTIVSENWLGKWNGPEGTFLQLERESAGAYDVIIQSLDGPASFRGAAVSEGIEFSRGGKTEIIHPGNGDQTGMKWLAGKNTCLIVKAGEGYCRD